MEITWSILKEKILHNSFWAEEINTIVYIFNQNYLRAIKYMISQIAYSRKKNYVFHFKLFESIFYIYILDACRKNLDAKSMKIYFLRFNDESNTYWLYDKKTKNIFFSWDVMFVEYSYMVE